MYVNKQLGDNADGTIGYDVFEDKSVEIDFDRMMMTIRPGGTRFPSFRFGYYPAAVTDVLAVEPILGRAGSPPRPRAPRRCPSR